jgi:hypothetical protein
MAEQAAWSEAQEMAMYHPGQKVELKSRPGIVDTIIAYDPMMVPPTILAIDPQPRYPEELILISTPNIATGWLKRLSRPSANHSIAPDRHLASKR